MGKLERKLLTYSAAAASVGAAGAAHAAIVYSPGPQTIANGGSANIDFNSDGVTDASITNQAGLKNSLRYYANGTTDSSTNAQTSGIAYAPFTDTAHPVRPAALTAGTPINGLLNYMVDAGGKANTLLGDGTVGSVGNDQNVGYFVANSSVPQYLGVQFTANSQTFYGWVGLSNLGDPASSTSTGTVTGYAYDDTGAAILAGATAVPEPAGLGLLAVGAAGLLRRRKQSP